MHAHKGTIEFVELLKSVLLNIFSMNFCFNCSYALFSHRGIKNNFVEMVLKTEKNSNFVLVIIAIVVCELLFFSILKLQQFTLIVHFSDI